MWWSTAERRHRSSSVPPATRKGTVRLGSHAFGRDSVLGELVRQTADQTAGPRGRDDGPGDAGAEGVAGLPEVVDGAAGHACLGRGHADDRGSGAGREDQARAPTEDPEIQADQCRGGVCGLGPGSAAARRGWRHHRAGQSAAPAPSSAARRRGCRASGRCGAGHLQRGRRRVGGTQGRADSRPGTHRHGVTGGAEAACSAACRAFASSSASPMRLYSASLRLTAMARAASRRTRLP